MISKGLIVEEIIDKKIDEEKNMLYQVKWKDLPESKATWETIDIFDNINIIKEFEKKRKGLTSKVNEKDTPKEHRDLVIKHKKIVTDESDEENKVTNDKHCEENENDEAVDINISDVNHKEKEIKSDSYKEEDDNKGKADVSNEEKKNVENNTNNDEQIFTKQKRKREREKRTENKKKLLFNTKSKRNRKGTLTKDIPLAIKTAKQNPKNLNQILCEIKWIPNQSGQSLKNTWYTNTKLKFKYPLLLLEYYENHLSFPKQKRNID